MHAHSKQFIPLARVVPVLSPTTSPLVRQPDSTTGQPQTDRSVTAERPPSTDGELPDAEVAPREDDAALVLPCQEFREAPYEVRTAIREARLFRAALCDTFAAQLPKLARALAQEVLFRELQLSELDLTALCKALVTQRCIDEPLQLRVAAADSRIASDIPLEIDPQLQPGDAILICRNGAIDARLAIRLADALAAIEP